MEERFIIEKLRNEDTRHYGFNLLVKEYQERVYWHVRKMVIDHDDSNDLTQDIFVKVWNNISSFREDAKLFTWIYRIATNECLTFLNKKKNKYFIPIADVAGELGSKLDDGNNISGDEIQVKLQKAILTLPDKQRLVFNMRYFDEMKFSKIEEVTGTSQGALKASYHHAVKKIESFLNPD
ncbi:MAG: sigma-70 family RNA polymerase sigma factor [Cytophagales bacterium]|nr:sigma-70 family RNA polymerase sigma factor [Cytophagales bacterium]